MRLLRAQGGVQQLCRLLAVVGLNLTLTGRSARRQRVHTRALSAETLFLASTVGAIGSYAVLLGAAGRRAVRAAARGARRRAALL